MWLCRGGVDSTASARNNTAMSKKGKWSSILKKLFTCFAQTSKETIPPPLDGNTEEPDAGNTKNKLTAGESGGDHGCNGKLEHSLGVASPTAAAQQDVSLIATQEVIQPSSYGEEWAALKIQKVFRGYLARRTVRAMRRMKRLETLFRGHSAKRQAALTFRCMQALVRVQAKVRARRVKLSEDVQNDIWQRRQEEYLAKQKDSWDQDWDDSLQTAEEMEAKKLSKHEAVVKRERALAYAYARQLWRSAPKQASLYTDFDPSKPYHWGWSWIERWVAARPWEARLHELSIHPQRPTTKPSTTLYSKPASPAGSATLAASRKPVPLGTPSVRSSSPLNNPSARLRHNPNWMLEEQRSDTTTASLHSLGHHRCCARHSISGSSVRDDNESLRSQAFPNYLNATESTQARSKQRQQVQSVSARRRLSFPATSNTSLHKPVLEDCPKRFPI